MYSANVLSIVCRTSYVGCSEVVRVVGGVGDLAWTWDGGDGALSCCVVGHFGAFDGHV